MRATILSLKMRLNLDATSAHAALSPWEGQNALDAAVLAYNAISMLRQQLKPTHRVHGIFEGREWAANSERICYGIEIPPHACTSHTGLCKNEVSVWAPEIDRTISLSFRSWYVRAPTGAEVDVALKRVTACFK